MKRFLFLFTCCTFTWLAASAGDVKAILAMIERVLPGRSGQFEIRYIKANEGKDVFRVSAHGRKIVLAGNNNVSLAVALNAYLRRQCSISVNWVTPVQQAPAALPPAAEAEGHAAFEARFYFNYCTFSYTMAFWDWPRWEKEIDWMALHGINMPLAIVGQEAVWQRTLQKFGYSDSEIKSFLCGPSYNAWWLMGNLEGWGGPLPQSWIDQQCELQKKIVARMRSLDIEPVLQGFYGMAPNSLIRKFPNAAIHDPGAWLGFKRPAMLQPTDPLFAKMAAVYYKEQAALYGSAKYFQGDPFHEGGNAEGVDLAAAGEQIYAAMKRNNSDAVWVLQSWQENPRPALLERIPKGRALIVNIMAEAKPQWGGKTKYWPERKNGFDGHDWIWSEIPDFGGRTGMSAKLDSTITDVEEARHHALAATMKGVGTTPEAIGQDEVIYDLVYDLAWRNKPLNLDEWLKDYTEARYGKTNPAILQAWQLLRRTVYDCRYGKKDPPIESILCARPGWNRKSASTWGDGELDYDPRTLIRAWRLFESVSRSFSSSQAYRYDLVNLSRQVLANHARQVYDDMQRSYERKDITAFEQTSACFIALLNNQDHLLATRTEFLLGDWLEQARKKGSTPAEKDLYESNARTLITTWTHEPNDVNDYSCREWSGLLRDYYLPRWKMFIRYSLARLRGERINEPDYFAFEKEWTTRHDTFPSRGNGNEIAEVKRLILKYGAHHGVDAGDAAITYEGRVNVKEGVAAMYWAGTSAIVGFEGSSVSAIMRGTGGQDYFEVIVDDSVLRKIRIEPGVHTIRLAEHLPDGRHAVKLFKCTQWDKGTAWFYGFVPGEGGRISFDKRDVVRRIEFYGNSITCGSAVEDSTGGDSGAAEYENNYFSYAAITARHYKASYSCIARSGIGLMVSWFPLIMPEMYDRRDPSDAGSKWDFKRFVPQVVVVNIGQNDAWLVNQPSNDQFKARFGTTAPGKGDIVTAYRNFVSSIRMKYPSAKIICTLGNMDASQAGSPWPGYISEAVDQLKDPCIYTHFFPFKKTKGHPNKSEQDAMAASLINFIDRHIKW